MKKVRINNIECRKYTSTKTPDTHYEIIKWYKNKFYNKKDKMLADGFRETFDGITNGSYSISNSCFINEESCYTVASLYLDRKEPDVYLESVGSRLVELSNDEIIDLFDVYRIVNKNIKKIHF